MTSLSWINCLLAPTGLQLKIEDIQITRHRIALDPPFPSSWDPRPLRHFESTIVRVIADDGLEGIGSGDAMIGFEHYKNLFLGIDPFDFEAINQILDSICLFASRCWPLDLALWDLRGKAEKQAVYKLLGGKSGRIPVYASTGVVRRPEELAQQVCKLQEMGFEAIKLRIGRRPKGEDAVAVRKVREAVGDDMKIMVDANQAWRMPWDGSACWTFNQARCAIEEIVELGIYWVEEPLHRGDFEGLRKLRAIEGFPLIASGEMNTEYHELRHLMEYQCVDVLQTDCVFFGGITGLARIAYESVQHNVVFSPHAWGNGIGFLANAQLVAGTVVPPYLEYAIDPPEWPIEVRDFMFTEVVQHDGMGHVDLGVRPGLGFELDEDILAYSKING